MWLELGPSALTRQQAGPMLFLRRPWRESLPRHPFWEQSFWVSFPSGLISVIMLPFHYPIFLTPFLLQFQRQPSFFLFQGNRNTSLPAVIKCEYCKLGRGRRTGERQTRAGPYILCFLLPSPLPGSCLIRILFEMSFPYTLCSTRRYSMTHLERGYFIQTLSRKGMIIVITHSPLLSIYHVSCSMLTLDIWNLICFSLHHYEGFTFILNTLKMMKQRHLEI